MVNPNYIARGKKWFDKRKLLDAKGLQKEVEWMDSQASIVADIKLYEESLKDPAEEEEAPVEEEEEEKPKSKKKSGGK